MDSAILAVILLGILQIIGFFGAVLVLRRLINAKQAELERRAEQALRDWTLPGADGGKSKLAEILGACGAVVGAAAAQSIMASVAADKSHGARAANGLADELQGAKNPVLGLLVGGKRGKGAALARLAEMLAPMFNRPPGPGGSGDPGGGNHHQGSLSL